jgi:hypothetical protein
MKENNFSKNVEKLVDPIDVGSLHFMQFFNNLIPKTIQRKLVKSSSKKTPYMGFVVEPYSYFLCYEIKDLEMAKTLIPEDFELIKTNIFANDEAKYYCIIGCINAHTSAFFGSRIEFYIIAEDKKTGLLSWIIVDYDTNTISYDKKQGLMNPNSNLVITTNFDGTLIVESIRKDNSKKLIFNSDIKNGIMTPLDQRLWLEGNLSIGYGKDISEKDGDIFSLKFNPLEVEKALKIPFESLNITINSWFPDLIEDTPSQIVCFPYAQHFISDSPGYSSNIKNKEELIKEVDKLDFNKINVFSTKHLKKMFLIGPIISFFITLLLLIIIFLK